MASAKNGTRERRVVMRCRSYKTMAHRVKPPSPDGGKTRSMSGAARKNSGVFRSDVSRR
jgi:hypothetical protein